METVRQFEHANKTIKIYFDPEPMNPRKEWDNVTTMVPYASEKDFREGGYLEQMEEEALADLNRDLAAMAEALRELE